ncbi:RNA polymerase sigma factor [Longitalea arenae]|uniref:RNA polymerase sigma factor n=1 Tax=Longitalea arenae TaxID=2812558 RepID=UPI0019683443|nr:RNA polymerase sigma-70 factor [Longitalea arenae]
MAKEYTEPEIIDGLKKNDRRVCQYLFDTYYTQIVYFTYRIVEDREEAEDIVIRTFYSFWNIRDRFNSILNIKAFLYITARNNSFNFLKYRQRQRENIRDLTVQPFSEETSETERRIIQSDFMKYVYQELQNLPDKCRQIAVMTWFDGLNASEIAEQLNISVSTVTTQRARAIKYLKEILSDDNLMVLSIILTTLEYL